MLKPSLVIGKSPMPELEVLPQPLLPTLLEVPVETLVSTGLLILEPLTGLQMLLLSRARKLLPLLAGSKLFWLQFA
jgi:hypothetical protein